MEDYKRTMGRVRASNDLKKRIKQSAELGIEPRPRGERRAVRPGVARALTIAATIIVSLVVLTAFVLLVRFVGPQGEPPEPTGEIGIAPVEPNGFKLISVSTGCEDVTVRVDSGTAKGSVKFTWINDSDSYVTFGSDFRALKLIDGEWIAGWDNKKEVIFNELARVIEPHSEGSDSMRLSLWCDNITPGRYKLERQFNNAGTNYTLIIEFELTEDKSPDSMEKEGFTLISASTDADGVSVTVDGYENGKINMTWINTLDSLLVFGRYFKLEKLNGENWEPCPSHAAFPGDAHYIMPGSSGDDPYIDLSAYYTENVLFGRYRVTKDFRVNGTEYTMTIEFDLFERSDSDQLLLIRMFNNYCNADQPDYIGYNSVSGTVYATFLPSRKIDKIDGVTLYKYDSEKYIWVKIDAEEVTPFVEGSIDPVAPIDIAAELPKDLPSGIYRLEWNFWYERTDVMSGGPQQTSPGIEFVFEGGENARYGDAALYGCVVYPYQSIEPVVDQALEDMRYDSMTRALSFMFSKDLYADSIKSCTVARYENGMIADARPHEVVWTDKGDKKIELSLGFADREDGIYLITMQINGSGDWFEMNIVVEIGKAPVEPNGFELISLETDCDGVTVTLDRYDVNYNVFSFDWHNGLDVELTSGYAFDLAKWNGETWVGCSREGADIQYPDALFVVEPHGSLNDNSMTLGVYEGFVVEPVGRFRVTKGFEVNGNSHTMTAVFEISDPSEYIPSGTGGAPLVSFVDCGNNVSDKFPGLIAEAVDFDDNKKLLWVDFTNKGSEDHTVDASVAIMDLNNGITSDMSSDANGGFSVMSGTVTHTSFALSNYWKNGEIVTGRYALLLNIDGQSVQLNFDIYVVTP